VKLVRLVGFIIKKEACKCVYIATVISLDTLSHTPSAIKTLENTEEDPDNPDLADGHIEIESLLMNCGDQV
jgi:hypothetical protein